MSDYRIEAATREEWANRAILAEARLAAMEARADKLLQASECALIALAHHEPAPFDFWRDLGDAIAEWKTGK